MAVLIIFAVLMQILDIFIEFWYDEIKHFRR